MSARWANLSGEQIEIAKRQLADEMIIVGSSDPTGHRSDFSQYGEAEAIRAFSDRYVQTHVVKDFAGAELLLDGLYLPIFRGRIWNFLIKLEQLDQRQAVADFLRQHQLADITVHENGELSLKWENRQTTYRRGDQQRP